MAKTDREDTGMEMANHWSHDRGGVISPKAMRFCGDEMGDAWPPMLAASAMAIYLSDLACVERVQYVTYDERFREYRLWVELVGDGLQVSFRRPTLRATQIQQILKSVSVKSRDAP